MLGINRIVSTVFGIGYLPIAPGTFAAGIAVIAWYYFAQNFNPSFFVQSALVMASVFAGVYCSGRMVSGEEKDPSYVVIDELAGMWLAVLFIPPTIINLIFAFALFRFFDIAKPLGIRSMEKMKNGWGIMLDDVLAGIYSNIALRLLLILRLW